MRYHDVCRYSGDDCFGKIEEYDESKDSVLLQFQNCQADVAYKDGKKEVIGQLRFPPRYILRLSEGARLGLEMGGEDATADGKYKFRNDDIFWFSSSLLEKLLQEKIHDAVSVRVVARSKGKSK